MNKHLPSECYRCGSADGGDHSTSSCIQYQRDLLRNHTHTITALDERLSANEVNVAAKPSARISSNVDLVPGCKHEWWSAGSTTVTEPPIHHSVCFQCRTFKQTQAAVPKFGIRRGRADLVTYSNEWIYPVIWDWEREAKRAGRPLGATFGEPGVNKTRAVPDGAIHYPVGRSAHELERLQIIEPKLRGMLASMRDLASSMLGGMFDKDYVRKEVELANEVLALAEHKVHLRTEDAMGPDGVPIEYKTAPPPERHRLHRDLAERIETNHTQHDVELELLLARVQAVEDAQNGVQKPEVMGVDIDTGERRSISNVHMPIEPVTPITPTATHVCDCDGGPERLGTWVPEAFGWVCKECDGFVPRTSITGDKGPNGKGK